MSKLGRGGMLRGGAGEGGGCISLVHLEVLLTGVLGGVGMAG